MFFFESFYYFYSLKTKLFYNEMKHIRLIFSAILLSLVVPCGYAQTRQDSLAIAHAQWHTDTLQHGAVCMYTNIHVFDSPQQISIIKYDPKKYKTQIVKAPQMTMTSHLAKENQAEAAINGSYFNVKTGAPTTFIRLDGIVRGETTRAEAFRTDGAISTDKNKIKIHTFDSITSKKLGKKYKNILAAGPLLLKNGVRQMAPTFPENTGKATKGNAHSSDVPQGFFKRHPRAFIGITPDNQIMMVVVDGRFKKHSVGMSIDELSYLAKQLGMRDALNLDGGGSSTLWNNKTGIVNHPYDNKKFDHEGEREVSNAILVIPNK